MLMFKYLPLLVLTFGNAAAWSPWSDITNAWNSVKNEVSSDWKKVEDFISDHILNPDPSLGPNSKFRHHPNLIELADKLNLTTCVDRLKEAGIDKVINHEGWFTLLCPNNEAFRNERFYPGHTDVVNIMRLHVVRDKYNRSELYNEEVHRSLLSQRNVRINIYNNTAQDHQNATITANGRPIVSFDHIARNGYLHILSEVMSSVYSRHASVISELELCCPQHSQLLQLVKSAGMWEKLDKSNPITLLAPLNRAFDRIHPDLIDHLERNKPLLQKILANHVIDGTWYTAGLENKDELTAWSGAKIQIEKEQDGYIKFGGAETGLTDVTACNGAVHSVASLILPAPIRRELSNFVIKIRKQERRQRRQNDGGN